MPEEASEGELITGEDSPVGDQSALEKMQALIDKHEASGANRLEDRELRAVLDEVRSVALSNIIDMFDICPFTGQISIKNLAKVDRNVMAGIKSIKVKRDRLDGNLTETVEFVMHDKIAALDKLMRYYGAYSADNSQKQNSGDEMLEMMISYIGGQGLPSLSDNSA